ncbi:MAG TPA: hypothetical protein VER55_05160, partial [Ardenticatenaceae bacterium]|nr:hypothetical protein [Ardenticatenaceae bacterium]
MDEPRPNGGYGEPDEGLEEDGGTMAQETSGGPRGRRGRRRRRGDDDATPVAASDAEFAEPGTDEEPLPSLAEPLEPGGPD